MAARGVDPISRILVDCLRSPRRLVRRCGYDACEYRRERHTGLHARRRGRLDHDEHLERDRHLVHAEHDVDHHLDHHLDEVFTLNDGTPWTFASVYCGTIDANSVWSGTGTFTLTSPAGDTLVGRSTSQAKIPSTGVPYHLDIESGTGSFTGASGPCTVDEHLAPIVFGVQRHSGSFTCTLTTPAGTGS